MHASPAAAAPRPLEAPRRSRLALALALVGALLGAIAEPVLATPTPAGYALLDGARQGRYLRYGMQGPEVAALQRALAAVGYGVSPTGYFGPVTLSCVRDLQRTSGLGVDGVVGPRTVAALDALFGVSGGGSSGGSTGGSSGGTGSSTGGTGTGGGASAATLPARDPAAEGGRAFMARTASLGRMAREGEIERALAAGNLPDILRRFREVRYTATDAALVPHEVRLSVAPDYLAVGSDADMVRMPMSPLTAQRLCDRWGCALPTRRIVDRLWQAADVRVEPRPLQASAQMMSNAYYLEHERRIEAQLGAGQLGLLVAGHKKDVVLSARLATTPARVAIYGWHWLTGRAIQPLSLVHENTYADYSHGVRLVDRRVLVDGRAMDLQDLYRDPTLAPLVSDEGPLPLVRIPGA